MRCAALALAVGGHCPDLVLVRAAGAAAPDHHVGRLDGVARQRRPKIGSEERIGAGGRGAGERARSREPHLALRNPSF